MRKFVIIAGGSAIDLKASEFDVHKEGCRDIGRALREASRHAYTITAEDAEAAVAAEVAEFEANEMGWTEEYFRVLPCARKA